MENQRKIRQSLKKISTLKFLAISLHSLKNKYGLFEKIKHFIHYSANYRHYKKINTNKRFSLKTENLYPRIYDNTGTTHVDPVYFYQNSWCAKKIFENKPTRHFDVGSAIDLISIISQFVPTTMVDIRQIPLLIEGLSFIKGDILNLPFKDGEISSLSSICVLEHIGLGRYGDSLDSFGSEKAFKELIRVISPGGSLYISIPVDKENKVYFNAHRAFTRDYVLELSHGLKLEKEKYIYGNDLFNKYDPIKGFGTGLYYFKKV